MFKMTRLEEIKHTVEMELDQQGRHINRDALDALFSVLGDPAGPLSQILAFPGSSVDEWQRLAAKAIVEFLSDRP
jgi:hypothetical protein